MATGLGIDLGASAIKVVKLRKSGATWQILRAAKVPDPNPPHKAPAKPSDPVPPRTLPINILDSLRAAGLSGSGAVGLTGRDLMVKYVSTPPVPPWKLRLMMDLEIKGTSGAEVCGSYANLAIPGDLTREMVSLVAVAKTNYVESQMALAKVAGLGTEWCCPNAVALFNAFMSSAQYRPGETTAILDIGRDNLELAIQRDGALYFARSAPGGGRRFTEAVDGVFNLGYERSEQYKCARAQIFSGDASNLDAGQLKVSGALREVADGMAAALRSAVMFCRSQAKISKLDIERVVLSGGGARLRGLGEYLKTKLNVPVDLMDPASKLDLSRLPRDQQVLLDGPAAAEFSIALGLAQAAADEAAFRVEVLPDKVVKSRRFWRGTIWGWAAAACLAGILVIDLSMAAGRLKASDVDEGRGIGAKQSLEKKNAEYVAALKINQDKRNEAEFLAGPGQRNEPVLSFVTLLRSVTPPSVTLEKLSAGAATEDAQPGAGDVLVRISGRVDSSAVEDVFATLKKYMADLHKGRPKQSFAVKVAEISTEQTDLEKPAKDDARKPFTFQVRLATLGVNAETERTSEGEGPDAPLIPIPGSIIPKAPPPPEDVKKPDPARGVPNEGPTGTFLGGGNEP